MSTRELQILNILFSSNEPMMVTDIMSQQSLSQSTVSLIVRKMLKEGYIEIAGYGRAGKVLSRMYRPTLKVKEAVKEYFGSLYKICEEIVPLDELFQHIKTKSI